MEPAQVSVNFLAEDNLLTAARRVVTAVRIDDQHSGALLSISTIKAVEHLAQHVEAWILAVNKAQASGDRVRITITKEPPTDAKLG